MAGLYVAIRSYRGSTDAQTTPVSYSRMPGWRSAASRARWAARADVV
jgi:hypothetical protein